MERKRDEFVRRQSGWESLGKQSRREQRKYDGHAVSTSYLDCSRSLTLHSLGLDMDRRRNAPNNAHPRSISMASPARPRFFARTSSSFMSHRDRDEPTQPPPNGRNPYDTQVRSVHPAAAEPADKKKKGIKGLLAKLTGRKKSDLQTARNTNGPPSRDEDYAAPLAPPPPISFLVRRADRAANHTRTSSSSSLSAFSGSSSPPMPTTGSLLVRESWESPRMAPPRNPGRRSSGYSFALADGPA